MFAIQNCTQICRNSGSKFAYNCRFDLSFKDCLDFGHCTNISNFAMINEGKTPNISENTTQGNMVEYPQGWRAPLLGPAMCAP